MVKRVALDPVDWLRNSRATLDLSNSLLASTLPMLRAEDAVEGGLLVPELGELGAVLVRRAGDAVEAVDALQIADQLIGRVGSLVRPGSRRRGRRL